MKILITGAKGFIGKNLIAQLNNIAQGKVQSHLTKEAIIIFEYDIDTPEDKLDDFAQKCDFVYHLAGINRPQNEEEFMKGNFGFTSTLLDKLKKYNNKAPLLITSSIQAVLDNPYGKSKKAGEDLILSFAKENNSQVYIYRLTNVFGKWSQPNYNSVVATFCNNIANDLPIQINNRETELTLCYIDDVVDEFIRALEGRANKIGNFYEVAHSYQVTLGRIVELLNSFSEMGNSISVPNVSDDFIKRLHATYQTFLPEKSIRYPLRTHSDDRGTFTEIFRTLQNGQFSVNVSKPGITKGNHWHHTKNEKFIVVSGTGLIRLRKINTDKVINCEVSGERIEVVDIPAGYTHNITNTGNTDMVTFMWCNECFNPEKPDTFYQEV